MRLKVWLVLLMGSFWAFSLHSQVNQPDQRLPETPVRCYTTEMEQLLHQQHPKLGTDAQFERWMAEELKKLPPSNQRVNATRIIPTVVHVIYSNATENISAAQVQSQIDILNEDFGRLNADTVNTPAGFVPVAANSDLEFCLAQIDPNGDPTDGINRVSLNGSPFTTTDFQNNIKPTTIWDPDRYFNIWVANLQGGLLGYAQFPEAATLPGIGTGNGVANTDGVVCLYTSFGRPPANPFPGPYNQGRTATHEVGHWLGLRHIWGDGNCAADDFCADTPNSDGPNYGCATGSVSCGSTDMVENYMDYSDDACMNIFTQCQKARMDVVMAGSPRRASLLTSTVCDLSPEINFLTASTTLTEATVSGSGPCRGFQDLDIALRIGGPPVGNATVTMTVVGGNLQAGADYDVIVGVVVFPDGLTGPQNFRLRIYDDGALEGVETLTLGFTISGTTDAFAGAQNQHTITLNDNNVPPSQAGTAVIYTEDFEGAAAGWTVQNFGGQNQWVIAGTGGGLGGARSSYVSRNGTALNYNRNDASASRLVTPAINATGQTGMTLSFDFVCNGEQFNGVNYDFGSLAYSLDGTNFTTFVGNATATPFVLVTNAVTYTVTLPAVLDNTTFFLGFQWQNDNNTGTNPPFAIDDINITGQAPVPVETTLNAINSEYLGPQSTVYWYDQTTGDVMLRIDNATNHDYGCTTVDIDRAGTGATLYMDGSIAYALANKTFMVTPTTNNPVGQYFIRLYYTDAEISGWETATGQSRNNITIAKTGGPISNITPATPLANGPTNYYSVNNLRNAYATNDFYVEGEFTTGFSGFGVGIENNNPVPVEFVDIIAAWVGQEAQVLWETGEFRNLQQFEVERQLDNRGFEKIGEAVPTASQMLGGKFSFLDTELSRVAFENVYYRIRARDLDGSFQFSEVRRLVPQGELSVTLAPNPFTERLELRVQLTEPGPVEIEAYNPLGQRVFARSLTGGIGTNKVSLTGADLPARGLWYLKVRVANETKVLRAIRN
ncbi:MAG: M43 family zinc metalloprotease [Bacteroidota bacterium]